MIKIGNLLGGFGAGSHVLRVIIDEVLGGIAETKAADNERETQRENLERFYKDRELLFQKFDESRGSKGNAFLPLYFGTGNDSFERRIADDYKSFYNATATDPNQQLQQYRDLQGFYMPMMEAGRGAAEGIFNGTLAEQRRYNAQPVFGARKNLAATQKQGVFEALKERINQLNTQEAAKGFSGTGSFAQNRLLGATIGARQAAAAADAQANYANAVDLRDINDAELMMKLENLDLPYRLAASDFAFQDMPVKAVMQSYLDRIRPIDAFRIGTAMPNVPFTPMQKAIPTDSQIWWQRGANIASNVGDLVAAYFGMSGMGGGGMGGMGGMSGVMGGFGAGGGSGVPNINMGFA